jgi:hypothetical protein
MNASQAVALHDLLQSIDKGDQNAVARAGITANNASRLMDLHAQELSALFQSNAAFIKIEVDNAVLDLLLQSIASNRSRHQTAHALIEADAPLEMVRYYYPDIQRTRSPDEDIEMVIATAWFHEVKDPDNPTPADYLKVHQVCNAPIRQIRAMHKPQKHGVSQ